MASGSLMEWVRRVAEKRGVFPSDFRVLLYGVLVASGGEASWNALREGVES